MTNPHKPNFDDVKVGDKCFEAAYGISTIAALDDTIWASSVQWYYMNGKYMSCDKHPTLFNSFQQFLDYWIWEAENGGEK